jgi:trigger factor
MLKTVEDISPTKKRLQVEIPPDAVESEIKNTLNKLKATTKMPGFRQGKTPVALIEKHYGKRAESEAVERVVPEYYMKAVQEAKLNPIARPEIEGQPKFERNAPFNLTFVVEVLSEIKDLNYEGVKVKEVILEVKDEDVEATIERLRDEKAVFEPSDAPVADGDVISMDYEVKNDDSSFKDEIFKVGSDLMPASFSERLIGMNKSEEAEFDVEFPEDYKAEEMAGKKLSVKVTVKDIKKVTMPDIDDEFAKDLGQDDLKALREHIRGRLETSKVETQARYMKAEVLKQILDANQIDAPESMVKAELANIIAQARGQGRKEPEEELQKELEPAAERQVKATLLLQAVAEKEGLEITEEEKNKKIEELATRMNLAPENITKYFMARDGSLDGLWQSTIEDKVLNILVERAEIQKEGE